MSNRIRRTTFILLLGLLIGSSGFGEPVPAAPQSTVSELAACRQLILVTSQAWGSVHAEVRCFERGEVGMPWKECLPPTPAVLGRKGSAWGIGLHGGALLKGPVKREGDERAPAGVFPLHEVFGYASQAESRITRFPYRPLTSHTAGVDDSRSRHYNRIVESAVPGGKDWKSAEVMLLPSGLYRWGVFVEHNWKQTPFAGSCIFLHIWEGPDRGTSGCTAMPEPAMEALVRWLDHGHRPLLVQLPKTEYLQLKRAWSLP